MTLQSLKVTEENLELYGFAALKTVSEKTQSSNRQLSNVQSTNRHFSKRQFSNSRSWTFLPVTFSPVIFSLKYEAPSVMAVFIIQSITLEPGYFLLAVLAFLTVLRTTFFTFLTALRTVFLTVFLTTLLTFFTGFFFVAINKKNK